MGCGGGEVSMGREGLRLTSGFQKRLPETEGGSRWGTLSTAPHKTRSPTSHLHPFSPLFQEGKKGVWQMLIILLSQGLVSPIPDLRSLFESSQDRESCFPHSQSGFPVPSQVSVCLPHKRAIRPSTEPQEREFQAQVGVRHQVSVKSRISRAT